MIEYIYFVKCPNCEDEPFDFFDEAKTFAMNCLTQKPVITQVEVDRNDFGECTDSHDLGTVWSWEEMMKDMPKENELTTFSKSDTLACDADYFNCEFEELDNPLDSVPDNFRRPSTGTIKEDFDFVDNWEYLDYGAKLTKEALYDLLVVRGRCVEIGIGDREHYGARFSDGSRYSDSRLNITVDADGTFEVYEWDHSDDGDSTDGEFEFTSTSFDELWNALVDYAPEYFIEGTGLAEGIHDSTRAPKDSDFVIVSKHPGYYSFLGNNLRMTKQLDKAMPYSSEAEAEYDIAIAEDQSDSDRYVNSNQFFITTVAEARKLLNDTAWRKAKQLSIDDMTLEALVEKMEENEDTVECRKCEELAEKAKCTKDPKLGWVCENCAGKTLTEGVYDFPYLVNNPDAKQQIINELDLRMDTSRYVKGDTIQVRYEVKDPFFYPNFRDVGYITDFNIGTDEKISVTVQDRNGRTSEVSLQRAIDDAATVNNHNSASVLLKAIKEIATNLNKANRPTRTQRAAQRAAAKDAMILSMLQAEPAIAEEFRDHIESIKFSIPLGDYEYDIDFSEPDADKALARLNRTRDEFLALPFAQDAIACGLVDDRKLFDDAGNMLEDNYGWVAAYWYGSCAIKLDCQVGALSNGAREVLTAAKNAGMVTRHTRQDQNKKPKKKPEELDRFDGYVLAKALITFFDNDVEFFKHAPAATATVTEAVENVYPDELNRYVTLTYDNMTVSIVTRVIPATLEDPEDYEEEEVTDRFEYEVHVDDVATVIYENFLTEEDVANVPGGLEALEDNAAWLEFLKTDFDKLFEKYYDKLLDYYEEEAEEAALEKWQEAYDELEPDPDSAYDAWRDEHFFGESLEESDEEFYARLTMCPECGAERSFDRKACRCLECKAKF